MMATTQTTTITLSDGQITALQAGEIIRARGIRYAAAERFQHPSPPKPWQGLQDCTKPAPICPQLPSRFNVVTGSLIEGHRFSEDCLNLTVTSPASALSGDTKLPVMVFFHGGAYVSGGGDCEVGSAAGLASRGAVVVSVTYRLGVFGYLYVPEVAPANLGLLDQIAALQWVQRNIAAFGGNATRVTIFGQSAGADSVYCLMGCDGTEELFHKAILQSAPLGRQIKREEYLVGIAKETESHMSKEELKTTSMEQMLDLQAKLILASQKLGGASLPFGPSAGYAPLPNTEAEFKSRVEVTTARVPVLIGWTSEEAKPYLSILPSIEAYTKWPLIGPYLETLWVWFVTGWAFKWPSQRLARQILKTAGGVATTYEFSWKPAESAFGAAHAIDLPFLFGDWEAWKAAPMLKGQTSQRVLETVGAQVKDLWVAFAAGEDLGKTHFDIGEDFVFVRS